MVKTVIILVKREVLGLKAGSPPVCLKRAEKTRFNSFCRKEQECPVLTVLTTLSLQGRGPGNSFNPDLTSERC